MVKKKKGQVSARDILLLIIINAVIAAPVFLITGTIARNAESLEWGDYWAYDLVGFISFMMFIIAGLEVAIILIKLKVKNVG